MKTSFVVRDTEYPEEDLKRNWSAFSGGSCNGESGGDTEDEARDNYASHLGVDANSVDVEFRYHDAYCEFVAVHYEGLGAFFLEADNVEDAIKEASEYKDNLAVTMTEGNGHFYAEDAVRFWKVRDGRYVFEIK